jgi:pimeloyl-ACP methyl ester carboxylesterase
MEATTQIDRISSLDENGLRKFITQQATDADLMDYWGQDAAEVRSMALAAEAERKRGDSLIVLLPGLMGSTLIDAGDFRQLLWVNPLAYARGHLNRLDLDSSGKQAAQRGVSVEARDLLWIVYAKMLLQLQKTYAVTTFPYDWRMATWDTALLLKEFIDKRLANSQFNKVTLVGHSLGGLLAMDYLIGEQTRAHAEKVVQRVVALGAPFKGALLPVTYLARGAQDDVKLKLIEGMNAGNKPLQMLRTFPSMYQILPAPNDLYPGWGPVPDEDIWQAETWSHQGVPINLDHLKRSFQHHQQFAEADPQIPVFSVVGALYTTPVGLDGDLIRGVLKRVVEGPESGDGTVAIASATFRDRPAYYVHEVHSELVIEKTVIEGIGEWVEGGEPTSLVKRVQDVVRRDGPMRGGAFETGEGFVNAQDIAEKATQDEPLNHEEINALCRIP